MQRSGNDIVCIFQIDIEWFASWGASEFHNDQGYYCQCLWMIKDSRSCTVFWMAYTVEIPYTPHPLLLGTVRSWCIMVIFLRITHERHLIARPKGRGIGWRSGGANLTEVLSLYLLCSVNYRFTYKRYISRMAMLCMWTNSTATGRAWVAIMWRAEIMPIQAMRGLLEVLPLWWYWECCNTVWMVIIWTLTKVGLLSLKHNDDQMWSWEIQCMLWRSIGLNCSPKAAIIRLMVMTNTCD